MLAVELTACGGTQTSKAVEKQDTFTEQGAFSADSAYKYIAGQVAFGPRVPGTDAHAACVEWLTATLTRLGAQDIAVSDATGTRFDGEKVPVRNIFARGNPEAPLRVLLVSHYDSRPWADHDADPTGTTNPYQAQTTERAA